MKKIFFIFLFISAVFSLQEITSYSEPASDLMRDYYDYECNLSENELNNIKDFIINNFNIINHSFLNISSSYCYDYGNHYSIYINMDLKKDSDDINIKRIGFSLSYNDEIDYNILMDGKAVFFDYYLKNKYYSYFINQTDENYYIMISYYYDENYSIDSFQRDLFEYYEKIESEKYFQLDYGYPIVVFKSKTSELMGIIPDFNAHISYYGDDIDFTFSGHSEGIYDLDKISLTDSCDIRKGRSYPEFSDECYGAYVDKERIYFSSWDYGENYSMHFSVYGVKGYKAEFSASYYGDISKEKVIGLINDALGSYFPGYSFSPDFVDNYDSLVVRNFDFDRSRFYPLNMSKDRENTNYYNENNHALIIEPHIKIYSISSKIYSLDSMMIPPFYRQSTVITKDGVYSSIQIKENNADIAKTGLNEMLEGIVEHNDWELNMSLRQYYHYYRGMDYGVSSQAISYGSAKDSFSPEVAGFSESPSSFNDSKFDELEKEDSILSIIIDFFKSFFI